MRFLFFLGPLCEGAPPAGGGEENLFPGDYDYIRQGRGHNVCLTVSRDGAKQAVDVCFDLTAAPAGDFSLAFDGGLTLTYADADRTCCLPSPTTPCPGAAPAGTSSWMRPAAVCAWWATRPHGAVRLCLPEYFAWNVAFLPNVTF